MKLIKNKRVCFLAYFVCFSFVISQLFGAFYSKMKNTNSSKNDKNSNHIRDNKSDWAHFSDNLNNPKHDSRSVDGIQMGQEQIKGIRKVLHENGNLLVWGLGNDSPYWHNNTSGKVCFIEDDFPSQKAGIQWYHKIMKKYPYLEAHRVHYKTDTVKSFSKYVNHPETWQELDLCDQLPESITQTHWHVIIIDAPLGCCGRGPGRYQSIYTSWKLAKIGTHIFVDDFERKVEHEFSTNVFGKPLEIIKREDTKISKANEQAHFIVTSNNDFDLNFSRKRYENDIRSNEYNWSILLTVNDGFFDFFNNWRYHFLKLNISIPVYVIAEDNIVYNKLIDMTDISMTIQRSEHISINTSVNYDSILYKKMVSARPTYILSFLKKGLNIIYSDIDTVWLKNPIPYFTGNFDIWSQMDLKSRNILCTGFLAIQSNVNTINFMNAWQNVLKETPNLNQPVFNELIRKSALKVKALEGERFPSGKEYFEQFSDEARANVVVVHNNWIIGHDKKLKRFKEMKLWLNDLMLQTS